MMDPTTISSKDLMNAIIYARVSTDQQEEDRTIESQVDALQHHPSTTGKNIDDYYLDDGVSGYSKALWDRPEGARLLADAEAGKLKAYELLVTRLNRLGRRAREIDEAIERLVSAGVTIFAVKEGHRFDNQTPMGKFTRQLFVSLDNKLHWRAHLEDSAREIQRDSAGERLQHLQANIALAQRDLNKVQKGFIQGIFTAEQSPHRSMDAREKVERAEKAIKDVEEAGDIKTELDAAMAALDVPMEQFLNELPNSGVAQLCRAVFQHFVVKRPEWRSAGPP